MESYLWANNHPAAFWGCQPGVDYSIWQTAIRYASGEIGFEIQPANIEQLLAQVLGEGQFGPGHWRLSPMKRLYYELKPYLPRRLTVQLRRLVQSRQPVSALGWPVEPRYAAFQWEVLRQVLVISGRPAIHYKPFWPQNRCFALILTHDIETARGQDFVRRVANLEEKLGFRSSFNFIGEKYPLDQQLISELRQRGFEIGLHGLKHDGKLFSSLQEFNQRAERINLCLKQMEAVGFRSPLTHRQPEWMQALDILYDSSFFDTDPYEPIPGGVMSIWPFLLGRFVELPYTLAQDHTLATVLGETTPRLWLEKIEFIACYRGMALLNTHPDYLLQPAVWNIYVKFLRALKARQDYWHDLPREAARWWRARLDGGQASAVARLIDDELSLD
jgi:peptidoglycan/xylan/chitin deacetylase (PgdA/CDA1 family)